MADVIMWTVLVAVVLALFLLSGAVIELMRSLEQVRKDTGSIDLPLGLYVRDDINLASDEIIKRRLVEDRDGRSLIILLSDSCGTCDIIAEYMLGGVPPAVSVVLAARSEAAGQTWLERYGLQDDPRVTTDPQRQVATALGISTTPAVIRVSGTEVVAAHTLPSRRRVEDEMNWVRRGGPNKPDYPRYVEASR